MAMSISNAFVWPARLVLRDALRGAFHAGMPKWRAGGGYAHVAPCARKPIDGGWLVAR